MVFSRGRFVRGTVILIVGMIILSFLSVLLFPFL